MGPRETALVAGKTATMPKKLFVTRLEARHGPQCRRCGCPCDTARHYSCQVGTLDGYRQLAAPAQQPAPDPQAPPTRAHPACCHATWRCARGARPPPQQLATLLTPASRYSHPLASPPAHLHPTWFGSLPLGPLRTRGARPAHYAQPASPATAGLHATGPWQRQREPHPAPAPAPAARAAPQRRWPPSLPLPRTSAPELN